MDAQSFLVLVGILPTIWLLVAMAAVIVARRLVASQVARLAAMSPQERELHEATREHREAVRQGENELSRIQAEARARLADAQASVERATQLGNSVLGSCAGITLTETHLITSDGTFALEESFTASVETDGDIAASSRPTFTRIAAGGLLFGPAGAIVGALVRKKTTTDLRELYLYVNGTNFSRVVSCDPNYGAQVRNFAVTLMQAGKNADSVREQTTASVDKALKDLSAVEKQTAKEIKRAQTNLSRISANTARMDAARLAVTASSRD